MRTFTAIAALLFATFCHAAQWKDTLVVNERIVAIHLDELRAARHHTPSSPGQLDVTPLDLAAAARPASYTVGGVEPVKVGRKTRPHTFIRTGKGAEHALEHFIYLALDKPLEPGQPVTITLAPELVANGEHTRQLMFDPRATRSPAIQTNHLGYLPAAGKIAHVSAWLGDIGGATFTEGASFHLLDVRTRQPVFTGKLGLRKKSSEPDGGQPEELNHYRTDLYECDFSTFQTPGTYILSVEGVGCSHPFAIGEDVYRQAYLTTLRGMYHQRCGTELTKPYTDWTRGLCHHPSIEPLRQTDHRYMDEPFSDGPVKGVAFKETGELRKEIWGGWHDAGDWDREMNHLEIAPHLLLAYELTPDHYADGELNIPESGNGVPDIVDEARWGVDYYMRVQRPDGGVSVGMFESRWPLDGETSPTDTLIKYCYAEDPQASYRHAAAAAHLARTLRKLGRADDAKPYEDSARRAWASAGANLRPGDDEKIRDDRFHAAAALYRLTGDVTFQQQFAADCQIRTPADRLYVWQKYEQSLGAWTMSLAEDDLPGLDMALRDKLRQASIHYARATCVETSKKRGNRRGYDWYYPFSWGRGSQPANFPLMVAHKLSGDAAFLDVMVANVDLTLGTNPLDMTWVTGLGQHSPSQVMQINYWYDEKGPNPGVTPMGPFAWSKSLLADGVWLPGYAMKFVYPAAYEWPPLELWFENRLCPPTNEFVVAGQASTGSAFGYLCAPARKP